MREKGHPVLDLCCFTCRRADTSIFSFRVYCKRKKETVGMFNFCDDWLPSKVGVRITINRFHQKQKEIGMTTNGTGNESK